MATKPKKNEKKVVKDEEKVVSKKVTKKEEPEKKSGRRGPPEGVARGRKKGITYRVKDKYKDKIELAKETFLTAFEDFEPNLDKFLDNGNKSAARESRKFIMNMQRVGKILRNLIQEAKEDLVEEKVA